MDDDREAVGAIKIRDGLFIGDEFSASVSTLYRILNLSYPTKLLILSIQPHA